MRHLLCIITAMVAVLWYEPSAFAAPSASVAVLVYICDDADGDGICSFEDNCPDIHNPNQADYDADERGDVCDPDDDNDGYADFLEEAMGSDPLNERKQPTASALILSPDQTVVRIAGSSGFQVMGIFAPPVGELIEYDMNCIAEYVVTDPQIVAVDDCGTATGQSEGVTLVVARQVIRRKDVATSNTVGATVDGTAPYVDIMETRPYDGQGMNEDTNQNGRLDVGEDLDNDGKLDVDTGPTPRVPIDSGIVIRAVDSPIGHNVGIAASSIQMAVNGVAVPVKVRQIVSGDSHEVDIAYRNDSPFEFDEVVDVELSLSDVAGNFALYTESFQIEGEVEHQWAIDHTPVQMVSDLGDGTHELMVAPIQDSIDDELLEGAKVIYNSTEPIEPRVGPVDELPMLDIATPVGIPLNLEPANVFDYPVTLMLPLPGVELQDTNGDGIPDSGLQDYQIYQYTAQPTVLWRNTVDVPGLTVDDSRVDHYDTVPPTIEVKVNHFSGVQIGHECPPPAAYFSWTPDTATIGETIQFRDGSLGPIAEWLWDFGDGTRSTDQNPSKSYRDPGVYEVALTVAGSCGADTTQNYVTVCGEVHLLAPANREKLTSAPTFSWSPGCKTRFRIQMSTKGNFGAIIYESPILSEQWFAMEENTWDALPARTRLYWRTLSWDEATPGDVQVSAETWYFEKR